MAKDANKKRGSRAGRTMMVLGLVLVLAAVGLLAYNQWDDQRAGQESEDTAITLIQEIRKQEMEIIELPVLEEEEGPSAEVLKVAELDGTYYMGVLTIPKLERILPIQSDWSMSKLKRTPCRYSGGLEEGELVICAHNYRTHFGGVATLSHGDSVIFTDLEENQYFYEVREIHTTEATDIEGMVNSGYDLTLFTCTYGGKARITVRCEAVEPPQE